MGGAGRHSRLKVPVYQSEFFKLNYLNTIRGLYLDLGCFNYDMLIAYILGVEMHNDEILIDQFKICTGHPLYNVLHNVLELLLKDSVKLEYFEMSANIDSLLKRFP